MTTPENGALVSEAVGGGINRLRAFDGLFLRAEHLDQIQGYARALAHAAGQAAGYGVVYGFDVAISATNENELRVGAGLAIDPQGLPLRSEQVATVPLGNLVAPADGYWVVEIVPGSTPYGDEAVYGLVCDDPCSGGSSTRPFVAEGIRVRLSPRTEANLGNLVEPGERRGWLASKLFENERREGGPWVTPATAGGAVPPLSTRAWHDGAPPPAGDAVPVAVLLRTGDGWEVDAWTVRRELGDPSPRRVWQWRLGMRPWPVFVAQLLQFQDLLTARLSPPAGLTATMLRRHVEEQLDYAIARFKERKQKEPLQVISELRSTVAGQIAQALPALPGLGIGELPPAGYLPISGSDRVEDQVAALLGPNVSARFCRCRPDHVPHAIEEVQHMDRIVLTDADRPQSVDILIPVPESGSAYSWVAFVRRRGTDCGPGPVDEVDVHVVTDEEEVLMSLDGGVIPDFATKLGTTTYPVRTWAVPPTEMFERLKAEINGHTPITLYGLASSDDRRPLAMVRAALLLGPLDETVSLDLRTAVVAPGRREAVVAAFGTPAPQPQDPAPGEEDPGVAQ